MQNPSAQDIQITLGRSLSNEFLWSYASYVKWAGTEFAGVRPWRQGDTRKSLDHKVTARKQENRVREYEEDKQLAMRCICDVQDQSKILLAQQILYTLGYAATKNNDKIWCIDGNTTVPLSGKKEVISRILGTTYTPKNKKNFLSIIQHMLIWSRPQLSTYTLSPKLSQCAQMKITWSLLVIISENSPWKKEILHHLAINNEILWIQIFSPQELMLETSAAYIKFNHEQKDLLISTNTQTQKEEYSAQVATQISWFQNHMSQLWWRYISLHTWEDVVKRLREFFMKTL